MVAGGNRRGLLKVRDIMDCKLQCRPLKLRPNRVWRSYTGGLLLDQWQGRESGQDGHLPEAWIASTVAAKNMNPVPDEGLSAVEMGDGTTRLLRDVIATNPAGYLGQEHLRKYGQNMAVLVKVIDAGCRLGIQVHPDRAFARAHLGSDFGKTESWYILGGRTIGGEEPYVLLGFKPGTTREQWTELFQRQDVGGMINCLHRIPVKAGEGFLIEGGMPHAIGSGCFLIEIQEPTDYTMRLERVTLDGIRLPDGLCHQGVGFEKMMDCFHYETYSEGEIRRKCGIDARISERSADGVAMDLVLPTSTPYFAIKTLEVMGKLDVGASAAFCVAVVISGEGKVIWDGGEMPIATSAEIFLPASLPGVRWESAGGQSLKLVLCYPPA